MDEDIEEILVSQDKLERRIKELGIQISEDYIRRLPLLVCILRGAFMFLADLTREIKIPLAIDFMAISTYEGKTESSGIVKILKDLDTPIEDRDVLIIEDIVDTGLTMDSVTKLLSTRNPKSIKLCTLLDKAERRIVKVNVDYYGFTVPNKFVVGYGLDFEERYRNLPFIGVLKEEIYRGGNNNINAK